MRAVGPGSLAVVSALTSTVVWGYLAWTTALSQGGEALPPALVAAMLFPGIAWAGALAAWRDSPFVTLLTGVIGLMPVGLYFLPAPGALKLIGAAPLLMMVAGIWMIRRLRNEPVEPTAAAEGGASSGQEGGVASGVPEDHPVAGGDSA